MSKSKTELLNLSAQELRQRLDYDPASGVFTRRGSGKPISSVPNGSGYLRISIDGVSFKAHRLAWLWVHGCWPERDLDHVNGDRVDNRLVNLRMATRSQNQQNHPLRRDTSSGFKGVYKHTLSSPNRPRWVARIKYDGKYRHIGCFDTPEEASEAYKREAQKHFGQFARFN